MFQSLAQKKIVSKLPVQTGSWCWWMRADQAIRLVLRCECFLIHMMKPVSRQDVFEDLEVEQQAENP